MIYKTLLGEEIDMNTEIWKRCIKYGSNKFGSYFIVSDFEVSNFGNVRGIFDHNPVTINIVKNRRCLGTTRKTAIYLYVDLLFNGSKNKGYVVHHKDFNKLNDRLDNLERLTISEHMKIHSSLNNKGGLKKGTKKSITNGIESRYINISDEIPEGWWEGRTTKAANQYTKK